MENKKEYEVEVKLTGKEEFENTTKQVKSLSDMLKIAINGVSNLTGVDGTGIADMFAAPLDVVVDLNKEIIHLTEGQKRYNSYIDGATLNITALAEKYDEAKLSAIQWGLQNDVLFGTITQQEADLKLLDLEKKKRLKELKETLDEEGKKLKNAENRPLNIKTIAAFGILGFFTDKKQTETVKKIAQNNYNLALKDFQKGEHEIEEEYRIREGMLKEQYRNEDVETEQKAAADKLKSDQEAAAARLRAIQAYQAQRRKIEQQIAEHSKQTAQMEWDNDMRIVESKKQRAQYVDEVEQAYSKEVDLLKIKHDEEIEAVRKHYVELKKQSTIIDLDKTIQNILSLVLYIRTHLILL